MNCVNVLDYCLNVAVCYKKKLKTWCGKVTLTVTARDLTVNNVFLYIVEASCSHRFQVYGETVYNI